MFVVCFLSLERGNIPGRSGGMQDSLLSAALLTRSSICPHIEIYIMFLHFNPATFLNSFIKLFQAYMCICVSGFLHVKSSTSSFTCPFQFEFFYFSYQIAPATIFHFMLIRNIKADILLPIPSLSFCHKRVLNFVKCFLYRVR